MIVQATDTVGVALSMMIEHRIFALPVVDPVTSKPIDVISMLHILSYFLDVFKESDFQLDMWRGIRQLINPKENQVTKLRIAEFLKRIDKSIDPVDWVDADLGVFQVIRRMVEKKLRRVLVVNSNGHLSNFVTEFRIVNLLGTVMDLIPSIDKSLEDLHIGTSPVITVRTNITAFAAFKTMREHNVSGVGVVDRFGSLTGVISISDLKLIGGDMKFWNLLGLQVKDYMKQIRAFPEKNIRSHLLSWRDKAEEDPGITISVLRNETLRDVIKFVNYYHIHRVFVVDEKNRPVQVITLHDILIEVLSS